MSFTRVNVVHGNLHFWAQRSAGPPGGEAPGVEGHGDYKLFEPKLRKKFLRLSGELYSHSLISSCRRHPYKMVKVASEPPNPAGTRTRCESPRAPATCSTLQEPVGTVRTPQEAEPSFRSLGRAGLAEQSMSFRSRGRFAGLTRSRTSARLVQAASIFSRKRKSLVSEDFKRRYDSNL